MTVKVKRFLADLGNSRAFALVNGDINNIIDIPTAVKELPEYRAKGFLTEKVDADNFKTSILIKYQDKYYLVGESAERQYGNDTHIESIHTKSDSIIAKLMYLALVAVYEVENVGTSEDTEVEIDYLSTMLPIFELLRTDKFSDITGPTAAQYKEGATFEILTPGWEKEVTIKVNTSKCYPEGLVAKYALRYDLKLEPKTDVIEKFRNNKTVNLDLGGGTIDAVLLEKGLGNPLNRDSYKANTDLGYMKLVVKRLYEKLPKHFEVSKLRGVERFIVDHYKENTFILTDSITGEKYDLTETIEQELRNYTFDFMEYALQVFKSEADVRYKYNYYGGVAPILRKYITEYITERFDEDYFDEYHHIEPDKTARYLNLFGLEVIARQETLTVKN